MPAEKSRADSLREYLTGALTAGGAQEHAHLSLGGHRSSTEAESLTLTQAAPLTGLAPHPYMFAGGGNALGVGTLRAVDANTVQWKCAGGDYGPTVSIAPGEWKIVETAYQPGAYLRIYRSNSQDIIGTDSITLSRKLNNVYGFSDVSVAQATAGIPGQYRATMLVNESPSSVLGVKRWIGLLGTSQTADGVDVLGASGAGVLSTAGSFASWPETGFCHIKTGATTREIVYYSERTDTTLTVSARGLLTTSAEASVAGDVLYPVPGVAIAFDPDGITDPGVAIQTAADEFTSPTHAPAWSIGIDAASGLVLGDMATDKQVGFWLWREVPPGAVSTISAPVVIEDQYDAA